MRFPLKEPLFSLWQVALLLNSKGISPSMFKSLFGLCIISVFPGKRPVLSNIDAKRFNNLFLNPVRAKKQERTKEGILGQAIVCLILQDM